MEHPLRDFHDELGHRDEKPGLLQKAGLAVYYLRRSALRAASDVAQPRVRERIMKLSKVYSATCHHRYWSER